ncbi:MAG: DedA family protein [Bryobacteraceae bacterium]|jgi:membrane protein DedA with SNARE-associated domain
MSDQLLSAVSLYGAPALFGIVAIASLGVPLPVTLLLIVAGSMISQGAMHLCAAIGVAGAGSILGDQAGYAIGRWGGSAAIAKLSRLSGKNVNLQAMEAKVESWGGPGIFITRWLLSPLGPWINLASGTARYPWRQFLLWDVLGELTGAALFISLGRYFSDRVIALEAVLGDVTWAIAALLVTIILGYQMFALLRRSSKRSG